MKMTRSEILCFLLGIFCIMQITIDAAPVSEIRDTNNIVDEILMRLKQLKAQSEGKKMNEVMYLEWV